jgi:hypothetical protein
MFEVLNHVPTHNRMLNMLSVNSGKACSLFQSRITYIRKYVASDEIIDVEEVINY